MSSNFSPVPRNMDIWGSFNQTIPQPGKAVHLVSLAARWLYDTDISGQVQDDPLSPLTIHGEWPTSEGDPIAVSSDSTGPAQSQVPHVAVQIAFDIAHDAHHSMPVHPLDSEDGMAGYVWTEAQRAQAKLAPEPQTVEELKKEV